MVSSRIVRNVSKFHRVATKHFPGLKRIKMNPDFPSLVSNFGSTEVSVVRPFSGKRWDANRFEGGCMQSNLGGDFGGADSGCVSSDLGGDSGGGDGGGGGA